MTNQAQPTDNSPSTPSSFSSSFQSDPHWHAEASTALFHSPFSTDPSTHTFNDPPPSPLLRRDDGSCTHTLAEDGKACACGKVGRRRDSFIPAPTIAQVVGEQRQQQGQGSGEGGARQEGEVKPARRTRKDSYEEFKRGWYKGWLEDTKDEETKDTPWGFSSAHGSPERMPASTK